MFLKRIELQGFKSFADKSIITFDSDVTGIVGPNGCGKSNINDAIRWVLGEQSVKSLRGGNSMSDIIFSGSAQRKAVNLAEVTLVFDNTKRFFDIAYDEVEITRRLRRQNSEAEYLINKTPCRLKDITDLVMDTGLGRDSLSIITQGNISSFAEAKPEERRALFEEAAGVAKYKKRKNVSLHKLKNTQDNLARLEDIILELERQVGPLKRQAKKAKQYIEYKEELSKIEINVIIDEIEGLQQQISELEQRRFDLDSQCAMHETTIQVQDVENEELRKEMLALDREVNQLQGDYSAAMEESNRLERRKVELNEKRKYALEHASSKERAKELKAMVEEAKFEYEDRRRRKSEMESNLALAKQQIAQLESDIGKARMELEGAQDMYQRLLNRRDVLNNLIKEPFNHQQGVRAVVAAKASLAGIEGVVSELLIPAANYENAISNALGGAMYHIVASDERAARGAIAFLKKNRSGRATFLPMSVLKPRYVAKEQLFVAQHCEGFLGCASEFVEYDARYDVLAKALLGNVLVCDQLEHANELAKRLHYGFKIVTLDGDIVHRGGSMTGGTSKNTTTPVNVQLSLLATGIAVACTAVAALGSCYNELRSTPAQLMRPAAPPKGKRVLLEYLPFIWKRISFTTKATIRNLFRYKKRFLMTVFGIGACMALLMVGFGLRDSIQEIVDNQYQTLWIYDAGLTIDEDKTLEEQEADRVGLLETYPEIESSLLARTEAVDAGKDSVEKSAYIFVPQTTENMDQFVVLQDRITGEKYTLDSEGVIISEKLSTLLDVQVGDEIYLKDGETERYTVTVTAISENYLYHYIYMTSDLYESLYGETPAYNQLYLNIPGMTDEEQRAFTEELLADDMVESVEFAGDLQATVQDMMRSLDMVIWVLIISAGLLAYVVLYNLNNINITERRRELATLKVLGFYDGEVAAYVYRENIYLTILGVAFGVVLGIFLHRYVILTCEIDTMMFGRDIRPLSYVYSILITIMFTIFVNLTMFYRLRKIDMVESLKSVE